MRTIFVVCAFFIAFPICKSQNDRDTTLNMVLSHPYFYNTIQGADGTIYTGTEKGILKWSGLTYETVSSEPGYIAFDKKAKPIVVSDGLANHENHRYSYLLPFPQEVRDGYHAGNSNNFYIVSGGRLHIYDILPYSIKYKNKSVRSISENYVGTYSGIYALGQKISFPTFTDGYIREIGKNTFICFNGLVRISGRDTFRFFNATNISTQIGTDDIGRVSDIIFMPSEQQYYLASTKGLYTCDTNFRKARTVYSSTSNTPTVFISQLFNVVHFAISNQVLRSSQLNSHVDTMATVNEPILDGLSIGRTYYLLTKSTLYRLLTNGDVEAIAHFREAHTLMSLSGKELLIASNIGLFHLNLETLQKGTIINAVEFNRRALYQDENKVYAGSVNGLFILNKKEITDLIRRNGFDTSVKPTDRTLTFLFGLLLLSVAGLSFALVKTQKNLKQVSDELNESKAGSWGREDIEQYIRENLTQVSIKSILEHFDTNTKQLYKVLQPDKPGTIIQNLRQEIIAEMYTNGATAKNIAEATGLSESYIKKCISTLPS